MNLPTAERHQEAVDAFDVDSIVDALTDDPLGWRDLLDAAGYYLRAVADGADQDAVNDLRDGLAARYSELVEQLADED